MTGLIIDNPHTPVSLQFLMNGPIFDQGLPIPITTKSLENLQSIFDKTYLVLANKNRMSATERSLFYLKSSGIRQGSLDTDIGLIFTAAQATLPVISNLGPSGVWEYTVQAYELLKTVFSAKQEGAQVRIEKIQDSIVMINTGNQTFEFNGATLAIASSVAPNYESFAKLLSEEKVTNINLGEVAKLPKISLGLHDKKLFDLPSEINEFQHEVHCEIFEFDKYEGTGRLSVFNSQSIATGDYRFEVMTRHNMNEYIEAMLHKHIRISCLEEIVDHPIQGRKIISLKVLKVKGVEN